MKGLVAKVRRNLARPLPDLLTYISAKIGTRIWSLYLKSSGPGLYLSAGTRIRGGERIEIGANFYGGPFLWLHAVDRYCEFTFDPHIIIGKNVSCSDSLHIAATTKVTISDGVLIGRHVHITDHAHGTYAGPYQDVPTLPPVTRKLSSGRAVLIGENVWLGDGVVVLPGVTIGAGTIVGANSVVSRSLESNVIAVGAPAVPIKYYDFKTGLWTKFEDQQ